MRSFKVALLGSLAILLLGSGGTSAFAQPREALAQSHPVASEAPSVQPYDFGKYFSTSDVWVMLSDFSGVGEMGTVTEVRNEVATTGLTLTQSIQQNYGEVKEIALKAVTFEALSSAVETGLFVAFFGGSLATAGGIFVVSFVSSTAVYVAHEFAWDYFSPPDLPATAPERIASKAATYRALSIFRTFVLGNVFGGTQEVAESLGFALTASIADTALYGAVEYSFESLFATTRSPAKATKAP